MPKLERRSITLFDIMAFIAATAIGLGIARVGWPPPIVAAPGTNTITSIGVKTPSGYKSRMAVMPILQWIAPGFSVLAAWSAALTASRLRKPRPRWVRLGAQPGLVAAVAVAAVWLIEIPPMVWLCWYDGRLVWASASRNAQVAANFTLVLGQHSGLAVAVAWATLVLSRRWRPEPGWLDRWGRIMGFAWIVLGSLCSVTIDQSVWWGDLLSP